MWLSVSAMELVYRPSVTSLRTLRDEGKGLYASLSGPASCPRQSQSWIEDFTNLNRHTWEFCIPHTQSSLNLFGSLPHLTLGNVLQTEAGDCKAGHLSGWDIYTAKILMVLFSTFSSVVLSKQMSPRVILPLQNYAFLTRSAGDLMSDQDSLVARTHTSPLNCQ